MQLGIGPSISKVATTMRTFVIGFLKDNLKLFFDFQNTNLEHVGTGSAYFDGDGDYIEVEHDLGVDTNHGTVMFWMKRLSMNTVDYFVDFRGTDSDNTPSGSGILYSSSSSAITVNSFNTWYQRYVNGAPTNNLNHSINEWVHICVTGMDLKITENGFNIGARYDNGSNTNMYMKNFAIWERDLNASEVQNIMHKTYNDLQATEKTGLKAWYALESDANDSHNTYHGGAIGNTAFSTSIYGDRTPKKPRGVDNSKAALADQIGSGSASFDGVDNYINCGLIDFNTDDVSIVAWYKADTLGAYEGIVNNRDSSGDKVGIQIRIDDGGDDIELFTDCGSTTFSTKTDSFVPAVGEWAHVAATIDRSGLQSLYINGVLQATTDISGQSSADLTSADNLRIGRNEGTAYFDGNIAQVGIWVDRVLTQEEIQEISQKQYSELTTSEKTKLVSWWGLDSVVTATMKTSSGVGAMDFVTPDLNNGETLGSELFLGSSVFVDNDLYFNPYGSNTMSYTSNSVTITHDDNTAGALWYFNNTTNSAAGHLGLLSSAIEAGSVYKITIDLQTDDSNLVLLSQNSDTGNIYSTSGNGTKIIYILGKSTGSTYMRVSNLSPGKSVTLSNFSVKKVTQHHGFLL